MSRDQWLAARKQLLSKEKKLTRLRDDLSAERRALPWVKVEKPYVFERPDGRVLADHIDGALAHLEHRDVTLLAVPRAPLAQIQAFRTRMGWRFKWVSSYGSDFNFDYHVSFAKDGRANGKVDYNE